MAALPSNDIFHAYLLQAVEQMQAYGVYFEAGLTDSEIEQAQTRYQLRFPPDYRQFLQIALPLLPDHPRSYPNWRSTHAADIDVIQWRLNMPFERLANEFVINERHFWLPEWDAKPDDINEAIAYVHHKVSQAPRLIPVCGHRFIPETPHQAGNPIFSMYGDDTIYYGFDFANYLHREFEVKQPRWAARRPRRYIPFWEELVAANDGRAPRSGYAIPLEKNV